jgi:hypothetical protein
MHTTTARVGLEPTIPVFERAKTFYALDRAATVNGPIRFMICKMWSGNKICLNIFKTIVSFLKFLTHTHTHTHTP